MMLIKLFTPLVFLVTVFLSPASLGDHIKKIQSNGERAGQSELSDFNSDEPILPIPKEINVDPKKVALGLRLFEDKQLSEDGSMACRSCHHLEQGGTDGERFSASIDGGYRSRNTPSIFNVGLLGLYGWYGIPTNLGDLAEAIIKSKKGLASDWPDIINKLNHEPDYIASFSAIYSDGIQPENIKDALAEYMRSLVTPNSRFDQYLRGNLQAITQQEKEGYQLFKRYGCSSCHQGVAVGGNMVAPFNLFRNYLTPEHTESQLELGRFNKSNDEADKYVFRVPSLRNVALTAPYFHDGSTKRLESAVDSMARYMLGKEISKHDRKLIVQFLHTLTGTYQGKEL